MFDVQLSPLVGVAGMATKRCNGGDSSSQRLSRMAYIARPPPRTPGGCMFAWRGHISRDIVARIAHSSRRDYVMLSMSVGLQRRCWTSRPAAWHRSPRRPGASPLASRRARSEPSLLSIERSKRGKLFKIYAR